MRTVTRIFLGSLLVLGLAGCSSGGDQSDHVASLGGASPASASAASGGTGQQSDAARHDALVKYAQCMRAHGINIPDPVAGGALQGQAMPTGSPAEQQKLKAASSACASNLPNGGQPTAQDLQRQIKFAQCMRAHGVNMPDPTPGSQAAALSLDDPNAQAALKTCESALTESNSNGG